MKDVWSRIVDQMKNVRKSGNGISGCPVSGIEANRAISAPERRQIVAGQCHLPAVRMERGVALHWRSLMNLLRVCFELWLAESGR